MFLQPLDEGSRPLDAEHRIHVGVVGALVATRGILVEVEMGFVDDVAGGVVDQEIGVRAGPVIGAGPAIAFDEDQRLAVDLADGVHRRLRRARPEPGRAVGLVHDVVAVQGRVVPEALGQLAPHLGISLVGHFSRADQLTLITTIVVHVENDFLAMLLCQI